MHTCTCISSGVYTNLFLNGQFYFDSFWMRLCPHKPSINQANLQGDISLDLKFTNHSKLASNMQKLLSKQSHRLALWVMDQVTQVSTQPCYVFKMGIYTSVLVNWGVGGVHVALLWTSNPLSHVRYSNILTWLRGFHIKLLYLVR